MEKIHFGPRGPAAQRLLGEELVGLQQTQTRARQADWPGEDCGPRKDRAVL